MSNLQTTARFNPTSIPGCLMWVDATDRTTLTFSGNNVSQWNDKSGNGYNFTQPDTGRYPAYTLSGINSLPTLYFTGPATCNATSKFLQNSSLPVSGSAYTAFSVAVQDAGSVARYGYNYIMKGSLTTDWCLFSGSGPTNSYATFTGNGTSAWNDLNENSPTYSVKNAFVGSLVVSGSSLFPFFNGSNQTAKTGASASFTGLSIGEPQPNGFSGQNWNGNIGEILIYSRALQTSERQQIEGYLAWKWRLQGNLPATHPFRTTAPFGTPSNIPFPFANQPVFAPPSITGCQLWLDATDPNGTGRTPNNGTALTSWRDKSANRLLGTAVNSPTVQANVQNGLSIVRFNGTNQYINFGNVLNLGTNGLTVFMVSKFSTNAGQVGMVGKASYRGNFGRWAMVYDTVAGGPTGIGVDFFMEDTNQVLAGMAFNPSTQFNIFTGVNNRTSLNQIYANGTLGNQQTFTATANNMSNTDPLYVAAYPDGFGSGPQPGLFMNGDIAEVLVYFSTFTTTQRQQVEGYLAWKWGLTANLPTGHPYKTPPLAPFPYASRLLRTRSWLPTQISGVQLWLDATDPAGTGIPPTSGSTLSTWKDKSSNGFSGTAVNSPVYLANIQNRQAVIRLNGTNQYINFGNVLNLGTNSLSIFVITKFDTTNETGIVGKTAYAAANMRWALWYGKSGVGSTVTGVQNIYQDDAQTGSSIVSTNPATIGTQYNMYSYGTNRNNFLLNLNGSLVQTATITGTPTNFSTSFNLLVGAYADSGGLNPRATMYLNGDIGEILVYFSALTTFQLQQVEGYLAWKWGLVGNLPSNHPFKLFPPPPI